jgi:hypothetical protein
MSVSWNPQRLRNTQRQIEHWRSATKLSKRITRLLCKSCIPPTVQAVKDFKPLAGVAVLTCSHERPVESEMTQREVAALAEYAQTAI